MNQSHNPSRLEAITTRWTLLRDAHGGEATSTGEARSALVMRYLPAVRRYIGAIVRKDAEADDLAQEVVVRLLKGDFAGADPGRGRFRDLLKTAIRNMIRNQWSKQRRRRTVDVDITRVEGEAVDLDEHQWVQQWREHILSLAWKGLRHEERKRPSSACHTLLKLRADYPDDSSEQLAARMAELTKQPVRADAVRQKLRRARLRFVDLLIGEVAKGIDDPTPEKIEAELGSLGLLEMVRDLMPPTSSKGMRRRRR